MNAHVATPSAESAADRTAHRAKIYSDIESPLNDLARHCRAMHVVAGALFKELRGLAKQMPQVAEALEFVAEDLEVLEAQIPESYIMSRDLRVAYYG